MAAVTGTSGCAGNMPTFAVLLASTTGALGGVATSDLEASNPGRKTGGSVRSVGEGDVLAELV
jgi:hypothetical protein